MNEMFNTSSRNNILHHIFTLIIMLSAVCSRAAEQPANFKIWIKYPSEQLMEMGNAYLNGDKADSALVCYSIVAGRYNESLADDEQKLCRNAYFNRWQIYFNKIYDFSKAYENLNKAEEISELLNDVDPEIELALAYFYETLEDNIQDNTNRLKNIEHCRRAFNAAVEQDNVQLVDRSFTNYITASYKYGKIDGESEKIFNTYSSFPKSSFPFFKHFNIELYHMYSLILKSECKHALKRAEALREEIIKQQLPDQFLYIVQCIEFDIYKCMGDYDTALKCMHDVKNILLKNSDINKRSMLEVYKDIYLCTKKTGDTDAYKDNLNKYLLLKDTLLNMKQITRMDKISFLGEISRMDKDLALMREKSETHFVFFLLMSLIAVIVVVSALILYKKNKHLSATNKKLYDNFNELIRAKDKEIERILHKDSDKETLHSEDNPKYKDSNLNTEEKEKILAQILKVMDDVEEICSSNFSAERLAELSSTSYKNVSQVINEKFECNFNVFLNRYRIEEACRRLSDMDRYGVFTIEAIAESVGFKSRTRFASNFKKVVGISPSEYRKITIERNNEKR